MPPLAIVTSRGASFTNRKRYQPGARANGFVSSLILHLFLFMIAESPELR
jgi:hypothetical protein